MAVTLQKVHDVLTRGSVRSVQADDRRILMSFEEKHGSVKLILTLTEDGEYIDLRTFQWATCSPSHPNLDAVLGLLARWNAQYKVVRYGWDADDGEVIGTVSLALEDNTDLPTEQLLGLVMFLVSNCDSVFPDLQKALRGGYRRAVFWAVALAAAAGLAWWVFWGR